MEPHRKSDKSFVSMWGHESPPLAKAFLSLACCRRAGVRMNRIIARHPIRHPSARHAVRLVIFSLTHSYGHRQFEPVLNVSEVACRKEVYDWVGLGQAFVSRISAEPACARENHFKNLANCGYMVCCRFIGMAFDSFNFSRDFSKSSVYVQFCWQPW